MSTLRLCYPQGILPTKKKKKNKPELLFFLPPCVRDPGKEMYKEEPHAYVSFSPHPLSLLLIWSRRITCKLMMCVCACQVVQSCPTLCDPVDYIAHEAPLSIEFSRQEYWSTGEPLLPGALPNPGVKLIYFSPLHWQAGEPKLVMPSTKRKSVRNGAERCDWGVKLGEMVPTGPAHLPENPYHMATMLPCSGQPPLSSPVCGPQW